MQRPISRARNTPVAARLEQSVHRLGGAFWGRELGLALKIVGTAMAVFLLALLGRAFLGGGAVAGSSGWTLAFVLPSFFVHGLVGRFADEAFLLSSAVSAIVIVLWAILCFLTGIYFLVAVVTALVLFLTAFAGYRWGWSGRNP